MIKKVNIKPKSIYAILLLGIFTFLFLGAEYLYVNAISFAAAEEKTVLAQNYALGASAIGFLLYPLFHRFLKKQAQVVGLCIFAWTAALCIFLVHKDISFLFTLLVGMALFLFLGLLGSAAHYLFFRLAEERDHLGRMVGISYALGIFLQFLNNNLVNLETAEAIILSVFALVEVGLIINKADMLCSQEITDPLPSKEDVKANRKKIASGGLLALLVILMACIFSTMDNAVTMYHVAGTDIGQLPRLLLAVSGLTAGFLFDIQERKYMTMMMYCVMLLSVICMVILKLGGPFLIGLMMFYLSAGFFAVFFTTSFLDFAHHMQTPALWVGMGRAMNNLSAALFANGSVRLLVSDSNGMVAIILTLILFVIVSVVIYLYMAWMPKAFGAPKDIPANLDSMEAFRIFSDRFALTPREIDVFDKLVNSEESIQQIADDLYLSRRTCQRYIAAIYEKAGVKSRMGLYQYYMEKQRKL